MDKPSRSANGPRRPKFGLGNLAKKCMARVHWMERHTGPSMEVEEAHSKQPPQTAAEAESRQQDAARPVSGVSRQGEECEVERICTIGVDFENP